MHAFTPGGTLLLHCQPASCNIAQVDIAPHSGTTILHHQASPARARRGAHASPPPASPPAQPPCPHQPEETACPLRQRCSARERERQPVGNVSSGRGRQHSSLATAQITLPCESASWRNRAVAAQPASGIASRPLAPAARTLGGPVALDQVFERDGCHLPHCRVNTVLQRHTQQVDHLAPGVLVLHQGTGAAAGCQAQRRGSVAGRRPTARRAAGSGGGRRRMTWWPTARGAASTHQVESLLRRLAHGGVWRLAGAQRCHELVGLHCCKPWPPPAASSSAADAPMAGRQCKPHRLWLLPPPRWQQLAGSTTPACVSPSLRPWCGQFTGS